MNQFAKQVHILISTFISKFTQEFTYKNTTY